MKIVEIFHWNDLARKDLRKVENGRDNSSDEAGAHRVIRINLPNINNRKVESRERKKRGLRMLKLAFIILKHSFAMSYKSAQLSVKER